MERQTCTQCGAPLDMTATECIFCGEKFAPQQFQQPQYQQPQYQQPQYQQPQYQQPQYQQPQYQQPQTRVIYTTANPAWPLKNKVVAAILAICLGSIGAHKFYLGKNGMGIVYLMFFMTGIPAVLGVIEGIMYLISSDEEFQLKNRVRLQ